MNKVTLRATGTKLKCEKVLLIDKIADEMLKYGEETDSLNTYHMEPILEGREGNMPVDWI